MKAQDQSAYRLQVFYDGGCPLCRKEINIAMRLDRKGRILFTDISAPDFDETSWGKSYDELMAHMHGRILDGTRDGGSWIEGVEVFRQMWGALGFRWLVVWTRLPGIRNVLDLAYRFFAAKRLKWRQCGSPSGCRMPSR